MQLEVMTRYQIVAQSILDSFHYMKPWPHNHITRRLAIAGLDLAWNPQRVSTLTFTYNGEDL